MYSLYSIRDKKTGSSMPPMAARTVVDITRSLQSLYRQGGQSPIIEYPEDYELWLVGQFDEIKGSILTMEPQFIVSLLTFKPGVQNGSN